MRVQGGYQPLASDGRRPVPPTIGSGVMPQKQQYLAVDHVEVAKLNIQPGEVVMVTVEGHITSEQASRIGQAFKEAFERSGGDMPSVLVVDSTCKVSIVKRSDLPDDLSTKDGP